MQIHVLGTSAAVPTRHRNVSALGVRRDGPGGRWDLFDCGEATQHRLLESSLSLSRLRRVFVSHLHGDHWFGLFGLLGSRSMDRATEPLTVIGPAGIGDMVRSVLDGSHTHLTYPLDFVELADPSPGGDGRAETVATDAGTTISALALDHRITSFAWLIEEPDRRGALDASAARALGVTDGPDLGVLTSGGSVTLADGTVVEPGRVVGPARPGRRVVIAGDNRDPRSLLDRVGGVDVLVHEATYTEATLAELDGDDHGHSTAARVASAAASHGVGAIVLTHFSARYGSATDATASANAVQTIADVGAEARSHFDATVHLAADLDVLDVSVDGELSVVQRRP